MSPPRATMRVCETAQADVHALLLDGEEPSSSVEELLLHVEACNRSAYALAHDRAMRRALARVRQSTRATESLRRRVRDALAKRAADGGTQPGGGSLST